MYLLIDKGQNNWDCSYLIGPMTVSQFKSHYEERLKIGVAMITVDNSATSLYGFNANNNRIVSNM